MALKLFSTLKKEISVKHLIHKRLAGRELVRPHYPLRASDLMGETEFCPREHAFMDMGFAKKKANFVGTSQRITYDLGKDLEYRIRNEYLRDLAVGFWQCGVCRAKYPTFGKAPVVYCGCSYKKWEYIEPRFTSPKSGISGGLDILLDVALPKLKVTEIKSIDKDYFKELKAPYAEHKFRTSLYLDLAFESEAPEAKRINTNEATIIYVSKSYGFKDESLKEAQISDLAFSPFKEYTITRDTNLISTPVNRAKALKAWRDDKSLGLPCQICVNGLTKRAQKCTAVAQCFSGSFPAVLTWKEKGIPKHAGKTIIE